jgi:C1A family cysteine protease
LGLPAAFSWLAQGKMTPAKNQGSCGSCWAFAACGSFEAVIKIKDNVTRDLAEQWLVNCTSGSSCSGGWCPDNMFKKYGAVYEKDAPYKAANGTCGTYTYHEKATNYKQIATNPTVDQIKQAIYTYGPVWVCIAAGSNFSGYKSGVLAKGDAGSVNHAVVLCGWDDATGSWVLRNSWGTGWGENQGYMRIKYGLSLVGYNATYIQYGSVTGIDDEAAAEQVVSVYPNPIVDGKLTVDLNQFESNQAIIITINDIQGKVVFKQEERQNTKVEIDAEAFSKGMYFVNVSSQSKTANYKIVKQ